ncbi:MAG: chromate resistance protein [Nitrospirae bacterium]|nr:chromate resistance protein [Nitrospirota bacterium]
MLHDYANIEWLLFFYSAPAKPVNNRIRVWRKLAKAGAVQLKDAVYILPFTNEHYEFFQWLTSEVMSMHGDALFIRVSRIETLTNSEVVGLFNQQRKRDYDAIDKNLEEVEIKLSGIKMGTGGGNNKKLSDIFNKCVKEFEEIKKIEFFPREIIREKDNLTHKIETIRKSILDLSGMSEKNTALLSIPLRRAEDYIGKIWVTRESPFVDRMSCAWLIKKFIDGNAGFELRRERDITDTDKNVVTFDVRGGELTHIGNMCTFEVFVKSFGLKDRVIKRIAEIVHEIDIRDDEYRNPETAGVEEILTGIKKTSKDDMEAMEKGIAIFEMLYAAQAR